MIVQNDWFMRQIEAMIDAIAMALLKDNTRDVPQSQRDVTQDKILTLLSEGSVCDAEDYIFRVIQDKRDDTIFTQTVLDFYRKLNQMDEEDLEALDFSHEEVRDGLKNFAVQCGMNDALLYL